MRAWSYGTGNVSKLSRSHNYKTIGSFEVLYVGKNQAAAAGFAYLVVVEPISPEAEFRQLCPLLGKPEEILNRPSYSAVALSPFGKWLAAATNYGSLEVWNLETQKLEERFDKQDHKPLSLCWLKADTLEVVLYDFTPKGKPASFRNARVTLVNFPRTQITAVKNISQLTDGTIVRALDQARIFLVGEKLITYRNEMQVNGRTVYVHAKSFLVLI